MQNPILALAECGGEVRVFIQPFLPPPQVVIGGHIGHPLKVMAEAAGNAMKLSLQLFSTPHCRRYQKMRALALETAAQLGLDVHMEEINDTDWLSQSNPLNLPRLVANGEIIASRNPPKANRLVAQLHKFSQRNNIT